MPFGPTIVELKDADYKTAVINDGEFITVSLVSGGVSDLTAGKTVLRFGVDTYDGVGNFTSLTIDKVCTACRLRFVYKSLQVYSDVFNVIPSPPYAIVMITFPMHGISAVDLDPGPSFGVVDKGGNSISTAFEALIYMASGFGQLRQRQNRLTVQASGGTSNVATFNNLFFSTPSTSTNLVVGFNAAFASGKVINTEVAGLVITGKIKYAEFQTGFLPLPNQTASLPLITQPIITFRDWTDEKVETNEAQIFVTASLLNAGSANLEGTKIIKSVNGVATYTNLAVDKSGLDYAINFTFISCDSGLTCDSLTYVCASLSEFCASAYTSDFLQTSSFSINVGQALTLMIAIHPSNAIAGVLISPAPAIHILDRGGNMVETAATIAVTLEANDQGAMLISSPDDMLVMATNGLATFTALSIDKTGNGFRLLFTSTSAAGEPLQSFSNLFSISAAPIHSISVKVQPGSALRGSLLSIQPKVVVLDIFHNLAAEDNFVRAVTAELIGYGQVGTLGGQVVQNFVGGVAEFTDLSINNPAARYIFRFSANGTYDSTYPKVGTGRVAINPPLIAESQSFIVMGLASALQVLQQPGLAYGGSDFLTQPRVALVDLNQQVVASATNTLRATIYAGPSGSPVLMPIPALQAAEFGIVQFTNLNLDLAGPGYILEFEVLGLPEAVTCLSAEFAVIIGEPFALVILTQPTDQVSAVQLEPTPTVKVVDRGGNTVPYDDTVSVEAVHGPLIERYEITAAQGVAHFIDPINPAGTDYRLRFLLLHGNATIQVSSNSFVITRGIAAALDIVVQPSHGIVNTPLTRMPVVLVKDAGGNALVDYPHPISVTRAEGPSASYTEGNLSVVPVDGEAYFNGLSVTGTARVYKLRFTTTEPTLSGPRVLTKVSDAFSITWGPTVLEVQNPPGVRDNAQIGGAPFTFHPRVAFIDREGQVVKAKTSNISLSLPPADGLSGTLTLTSFEGISVFTDLRINRAIYPAFHIISVAGEALTTTLRVQVKPGVASSLFVFGSPEDALTGKVFFGPMVLQFRDLGSNIVTGPTAEEPVTVQLEANKFGGILGGTLTATPVSGVVRFTNLKVTGIGNGYTLLFTSESFRIESVSFGVHGEPKTMAVVSFPAGCVVYTGNTIEGIPYPRLPPIRVALLDEAKNVITGGKHREPYALIGVKFNLEYAWDAANDQRTQADLGFDTTLGNTTAIVENGYALFDNIVITTSGARTALQGLRLLFETNISASLGIQNIISPFFSTSLSESKLQFKTQLHPIQSSGLTLSPMPVVTIHTGSGPIVRGSTLPVEVSIKNANGAVLAGTTTLNTSAGVYVFTDLSIQKATDPGAQYSLQFQVPSSLRNPIVYTALTVVSIPFTVSVGPPASISLKSDLVPSTSGIPFFSQPCVALRDAGENFVRIVSEVTASLISTGGDMAVLIGQNTTTSSFGLASFTNLGITNLTHGAPYQITFKAGALETRSTVLTGRSGPPVNVEIVNHSATSFGGSPLHPPPEMRVTDAGGTPVAGPVEMTAVFENNPGGLGELANNVAIIRNGTAKFTQISISKAGADYVIRFMGGATASAASRPFDVVVGPAKHLFVDAQPGTSVFGVNIVPAPRVVVLDAGNNWVTSSRVEIHAQVILPAVLGPRLRAGTKMSGALARRAVAGVAVFDDLTIDNAGSGFRFEFSSIGLDVFVTQPFDVTGPPAVLAVQLDPAWIESGTRSSVDTAFKYQPVVKVQDYDESVVSYYDVAQGVTASVAAGQQLSGNPIADIIRGSAIFTDLQLHKTTDTARLSFAYGGPMLVTSVQSPAIEVEAGTPRQMRILVQPSSSSRGFKLGLQPKLQVIDAFDNPVVWYSGTVSVILRLGDQSKQGYIRGTPIVAFAELTGIATFTDLNVVFQQLGFYMRFQTGGIRIDSQPFNIKQGPPGAMVLANPPLGGVSTVGGGILQPQPIINIVDRGYGVVESFSGAGRCAGHDCDVSVVLICCPVNYLGEYAGAGKLTGRTQVIAVNGKAFFTDLVIDAPGDYTLKFSVAAIDGISGEIVYELPKIPVQDFTSMVISTQPGQALLGMPMRGQPVIEITSSTNQRVNGSYHQVNVTLTSDVGCVGLQGRTTLVAAQGLVQFTDLFLTTFLGAPTCRFNFSTNNPPMYILSEYFAMTYGPSELLLPTEPAGAEAGVHFTTQPALEFRDKGNFLLASESGQSVSAELLQGDFDTVCGDVVCKGLLRGRTSILNSNGGANFTNLRIDKLHTPGYILLFRMGKYTIYSQKFLVALGAVSRLRVVTQPSTCQITIVMPDSPSIELLDAGLNRANSNSDITVRIYPTAFTGLSLSGGTATAVAGLATFNNIILDGDAALGVSLEFSGMGLSILSDFFLAHRPCATLVLQNPMPGTLIAGETFLPEQKVGLRDDFDFPALADSSSAINVSLINKDTGVETRLPDVQVPSRGLATFQTLKAFVKGERYVFKYYLSANPSVYAESNYFSVVANIPKHVLVVQQPDSVLAAATIMPYPSVRTEDEYRNKISASPGFHVKACVAKQGAPSQCSDTASLQGDTSRLLATETVEFTDLALHGLPSSGYQLLFYTDLPGSVNITEASSAFHVRIGEPRLRMESQPNKAREGHPFLTQPRIAVADGAGNHFSGSQGGINYLQVTATLSRTSVDGAALSDSIGNCPCTTRLLEGVATFDSLKINRAGRAFQVQFSLADISVERLVSEEFHVSGSVVYTEAIGLPSTIAYATPFDFSVRLLDANSLAVAVETLTMNVVSESGGLQQNLLKGATSVSAVTGVGVFNGLRFGHLGGPYLLEFNASGFVHHSTPITVTARHGTNIAVLGFPDRILAVTDILPSPSLQVRDEFGAVSGFTGGLTVSVLDAMNTSLQTSLAVQASAGIGSLSQLQVTRSSTGQGFRLRVEAVLLGSTHTAYSDLFHVNAGRLAALNCVVQPSNAISGSVLPVQPVVHAMDSGGNLLAYFSKQITLNLNATQATNALEGTNILLAENGVATFTDLVVTKPHDRHNFLISTSESCGIMSKSDRFQVTNPLSFISLTVVPPIPNGGRLLVPQPEVTFFDNRRVAVSAIVRSVTVSLCVKPADSVAKIHGTATLPAVAGVVRFTDIAIDKKGTYTICYTSENLVVNQTLEVRRGAAQAISWIRQPTVITAGQSWTGLVTTGKAPVFRVSDAGGNPFLTDSNQGQPVDHLRIEVLDEGTRSKTQMLKCRSCATGRAEPCYDPLPYNGVGGVFFSESTPDCMIKNAGRRMIIRLSIVDVTSGLVVSSTLSAPFDVVTGRCKRLKVLLHPNGVIVSQPFRRPPIVEVRDDGDNTIPWVRNTITVSLPAENSGTAILSGCRTANGDTPNTNVDGTATFFGCVINCEPMHTYSCLGQNLFRLQFRMASCDGNVDMSNIMYYTNYFTVSPEPNEIRVKSGSIPTAMPAGLMPMQPRIEYWVKPCNTGLNSECFVETTTTGWTVSAEIYGAPNSATLKGTTSALVVNGVAQFTDLRINEASALLTPSTYNISFFGVGFKKTWELITVNLGTVTALHIKQQPTLTAPGTPFGAQVSLVDAGGNVVTNDNHYITIALDKSFGVRNGVTLKTSSASLTVQTTSGVAVWSGLTVNKAPVIYSFTFSATKADGTNMEVESSRISVVIGGVAEIQLQSQLQDTLAGLALTTMVAQLYDAGGNKIRTNLLLVLSVELNSGGGTLTGIPKATITNEGRATFNGDQGLAIAYATGESQHVLKVAHGDIFVRTNPFFVHLAASKITMSSRPSQWGFAGKILAEQPVLEFRDAQENRAYSATAGSFIVTVALVETRPTLNGNLQAVAKKGVAAFTDLSISASGSYTLSFTHGAFPAVVSPTIVIRAGVVAMLQIVNYYQPGQNGTNMAGFGLPVQPRIQLFDSGGSIPDPLPTRGVMARISEYPSGTLTTNIKVLFGTTVAIPDPVSGIARFTNLAINAVGDFKLQFSFETFTVQSHRFTIVHGPIAQIIFQTQPSSTFFDELLVHQPVVLLLDKGSNPVQGTPWIHITLGKGRTSGSVLMGCTKSYAVEGTGVVTMAGCKVKGTSSGQHTLLVGTLLSGIDVLSADFIFNDHMDSKLVLESAAFTVALPMHGLVIETIASTAVALNSFQIQPVVHAIDIQGTFITLRNSHITVTLSVKNETLLQGNKVGSLVSGIARFTDLRVDVSGTYFLNFTLTTAGQTFSIRQPLVVAPSPPSQLFPQHWPTELTSGDMLSSNSGVPSILVKDLVENLILDPVSVSVTADCVDEGGVPCLEGTQTVAVSSGVSVFNDLALHSAGNITLTFVHAALSATVRIEVKAGAAARIKIVQQPPSSFLVAAPITPALKIQLEDAYGNIAVDPNHNTSEVSIFSSPVSAAVLSGDVSCGFVNGVGVFGANLALSHSGFGFRFVFKSKSLQTISDPFIVHSLPTQMKINIFPNTEQGGDVLVPQPQIKLYDDAGSQVLNPSFTVVAKIEAMTAALTGTTSVVTSQGVAQFTNLKLDMVGKHTLRFECHNGVKTIMLISSLLTLVPGAPHSISVEEQPGGFATGGVVFPIQPEIFLRDSGGNLANTAKEVTVTIHAATTAMVGGTSTVMTGGEYGAPLQAYSAGALVFTDLSINVAGMHILIFASPGLISAQSSAFAVAVGPAMKLEIIRQPANVNVGLPFGTQPIIQIQDLGGNHVVELSHIVTASIKMHSVRTEVLNSVELRGSPIMTSVTGWCNYTKLQIDISGLFCDIEFSSPGLLPVTSDTFIIAAISPASSCNSDINYLSDCGSSVTKSQILRVEIQPTNVVNGRFFSPEPEVRIRDQDGVILKAEGSVYASVLSTSGARLYNGTQTFEGGIAKFRSMSVDKVGLNYRIQFRYGDLVTNSQIFNVTTGAAAKTRFASTVPIEWVVNSVFPTFKVNLLDHGNFLVTDGGSACPNMSVAVKSGPTTQLSGTTTVALSAGNADFVDLKVPIAGIYSFRFTCNSAVLASAPLDTENIVLYSCGQPAAVEIMTAPGRAISYFDDVNPVNRKIYVFNVHPKLRLVDAFGNLVHGFQGHFKAVKAHGGFDAALLGGGDELTLPAKWGMVEFDNLRIMADSAAMQNESLRLRFGSTCCSLMSQSDGVNTEPIVINAAPTQMVFTMPASVKAGEPFMMSVTMKTAQTVALYTYLGIVAITLHNSSDNSVSNAMSGVKLVRGLNGEVFFSGLVISTPDTYFIRATATRPNLYLDMISQDSTPFTVGIGPGRMLSFLTQTSGCKGGVICTSQPWLQIVDASGNAVALSGLTVKVAVVSSASTNGYGCCTETEQSCPVHNMACPILGGTKTATSDAAGIVTFDGLSLSTAGTIQLNFTALGSSILESVHVTVGPGARAKILVPPSGLVAGAAFEQQPIVIASDFGGNWVSQDTDNVTAKVTLLGCTPGDLGCENFGTMYAVNAGGVSRFTDLGTKYAGLIRLEFRLKSVPTCGSVSCWSTTETMQVAPGIPSQLVIVSAPTQYFCSGNMTPAWDLDIRDRSDNRVIGGGPYSLSVTSTPSRDVAGTTTVQSTAGQASFRNLNIMKTCYWYAADAFEFCYTLTFRLGDITVTSNSFTVMAGPVANLEFHTQPAETSVGSPPGYPSVRFVDVSANPVIPVPAAIPVSCGVADIKSGPLHVAEKFDGVNILPDHIDPIMGEEKTNALSLLLGQDESYVSKTSLVFRGLNMNWRLPPCYYPTSCPSTSADFKNFRIRAVARYGSFVADSEPLAVDAAHPVDFNVYLTNLSAIVLRWKAPFFGPAPSSYHLSYRSLNTPGADWIILRGINANIYTFADLNRYKLMEFELCSSSIFGDRCALRGPAPLVAAPVQAVTFAEVAFADEESIFLSWRAPPYGEPPPAYQITMRELPDGWETVHMNNVLGLNVSVPDLSPNKTYVFGVYSKAAGGDYYSPIGAHTQPVMPTAATTSASISCPLNVAGQQECTGTGLVINWAPPVGVLYQPRKFLVRAEQQVSETNFTISFRYDETVDRNPAGMSVTITGLTRGRPTRLRLLSQSVNDNARFAPSVNFHLTPTAAPSPPTDLTLKMRKNQNIFASWDLPLDSGDGTRDGTNIEEYEIRHKSLRESTWVEVANAGKYNLTREFWRLEMNTSHTFRIAAVNVFLLGSSCNTECKDLEPISLVGNYIESTFVLGQIPYWDLMHAPVKQDPPPLYNLFVGTLFTFSLKALSTGAGERIKISATGLEDCGAYLTSLVVGNPATATLTLLPAIKHLDKNFWICFHAMDERGAYSDQRCLQLYVVRPNPTFLAPIDPTRDDPVVRASFTAVVGCLLEFDVKAHDLTSGRAITAATASARGYLCALKEHRSTMYSQYETKAFEGLPENALLQQGAVPYANPSTRKFSWRPKRGQEAFDYHVCFTVEDSLGTSNTASPAFDGSFCVHVAITRCRMCLLPGDSLFSVSQQYGTEWLNLWSGNSALLRPAEAIATSEIRLGPVYKALPHESITSIAARMSVNAEMLLEWNPDLSAAFGRDANVVLEVEQDICILPSTCTQ